MGSGGPISSVTDVCRRARRVAQKMFLSSPPSLAARFDKFKSTFQRSLESPEAERNLHVNASSKPLRLQGPDTLFEVELRKPAIPVLPFTQAYNNINDNNRRTTNNKHTSTTNITDMSPLHSQFCRSSSSSLPSAPLRPLSLLLLLLK